MKPRPHQHSGTWSLVETQVINQRDPAKYRRPSVRPKQSQYLAVALRQLAGLPTGPIPVDPPYPRYEPSASSLASSERNQRSHARLQPRSYPIRIAPRPVCVQWRRARRPVLVPQDRIQPFAQRRRRSRGTCRLRASSRRLRLVVACVLSSRESCRHWRLQERKLLHP